MENGPDDGLIQLLEPLAQGNLRHLDEQALAARVSPQLLALINDVRGRWLEERNATLDQGVKTLQQLMRAREDLSTSQTQLQHAIRLNALGTLAAGIAHEMSQPLTVILGLADLLKEEVVHLPQAQDKLEKISAASESLAQIIDNVLTFSRQSKFQLEQANTILPLNRAIALVENSLAIDQTELTLDTQDIDVRLPMHTGRIQQVLVNLLTNAKDALCDPRASKPRRIRISTRRVSPFFIYTVANNGPAIDQEHADQLFDPFFTTKEPGAGMGLGLAVSHGIVSDHQGYIEHSREDGWTVFTVALPLQQSELAC